MKKTKAVIFTAIITLLAFGTSIYTSCNKDRCSNVACQNGGTCVNGYCSCPTGYEGDHCEIGVTTTIQYWNHGFTDITLTLQNGAYTVPAGHSKGFMGGYGDTLQGNAFTHGSSGVQVNWDTLFNTFPQSGTTTVDLNIPSTFFYLTVVNDSASGPLKYFVINKNVPGIGNQQAIILPPPYLAYGAAIALGYFNAVDSSNLYIKSAANDGEWFFSRSLGTLVLPMTANQAITITAN